MHPVLVVSPGTVVQDEERLKKAVNAVPSRQELNGQLARSEAERVEFDRLDRELSWPAEEGLTPISPSEQKKEPSLLAVLM